jgi:hypothetical protein
MGFLSLALFPVPLIFVWYGERLRAMSPLANEASSIVFHLRQSKEAAQVPVPVERHAQATASSRLDPDPHNIIRAIAPDPKTCLVMQTISIALLDEGRVSCVGDRNITSHTISMMHEQEGRS